jgi:hypothetical protein
VHESDIMKWLRGCQRCSMGTKIVNSVQEKRQYSPNTIDPCVVLTSFFQLGFHLCFSVCIYGTSFTYIFIM